MLADYKRLKIVVNLILLGFFGGGLLALALPQRECFPVYSWSMFGLVPQAKTKFALLIHEFQGKRLQAPCLYEEAEGIVPHPHSVTAHALIQQLGAAEESQNALDRERLRRLFEQNFFQSSGRYELVKIHYDPLSRWETGRVRTENLKMFTTAEESR